MSSRSSTARREVGQTAPTVRGFFSIESPKSARRLRSSAKPREFSLGRALPF